MATLDEWSERVCAALALDPEVVERSLVLDVARDVAHGVARPAAPLTTYLLGVAVGRGVPPAQAAQTVTELMRTWPPSQGE